MLLSARILTNVNGVNDYDYADSAEFVEGDTPSIYFQLVDASRDRALEGFVPAGRRYVPASGATLQVVIDSVDDAKKVTRAASQPFANDPSIWRVTVLTTDVIKGTKRLLLTLTEGSAVLRANVPNAIRVHAAD
jgi:hypothetical protein